MDSFPNLSDMFSPCINSLCSGLQIPKSVNQPPQRELFGQSKLQRIYKIDLTFYLTSEHVLNSSPAAAELSGLSVFSTVFFCRNTDNHFSRRGEGYVRCQNNSCTRLRSSRAEEAGGGEDRFPCLRNKWLTGSHSEC